MKELRDWLKEGDPVAIEPQLSDTDVQRMRRAIVTAGGPHESLFGDWARGSWAAATVAIALTIAVGMSRWMAPAADVDINLGTAPSSGPQPGARRQMQLIAPGGTRVIWIFNADFQP